MADQHRLKNPDAFQLLLPDRGAHAVVRRREIPLHPRARQHYRAVAEERGMFGQEAFHRPVRIIRRHACGRRRRDAAALALRPGEEAAGRTDEFGRTQHFIKVHRHACHQRAHARQRGGARGVCRRSERARDELAAIHVWQRVVMVWFLNGKRGQGQQSAQQRSRGHPSTDMIHNSPVKCCADPTERTIAVKNSVDHDCSVPRGGMGYGSSLTETRRAEAAFFVRTRAR